MKYHQKYGSVKDKWLRNIKVFIDERCIDKRLPEGVEKGISNLIYFGNLEELDKYL